MGKKLKDNPAQEIQFQRLRLGSFNSFDGDLVADSLKANYKLWDSFLFGRFGPCSLIELRDLPEGYLNADTLYILTSKKRWPALKKVIAKWDADEIGYLAADGTHEGIPPDFGDGRFRNNLSMEMGGGGNKDSILVRVWWD